MNTDPLVLGEVTFVTKGCATPDEPFEVCVLKVEEYGERTYYLAWFDLEPEACLGDMASPEPTALVEGVEPFTRRKDAIAAAKRVAQEDLARRLTPSTPPTTL